MNQTLDTTRFGAIDYIAAAHVLRAEAAADMIDAAGAALRRLVGGIGQRLATAARRRSTCRELRGLDDYMLADIGLTRYDVEAYAAGQLGTIDIIVAGDAPAARTASVVDFAPRTSRNRLDPGAHRTAEAA